MHSYPFNEGKGEICRNYAWPGGEFDLKFSTPNVADSPRWGTYFKVPGLELDIDQSNPLTHVTNTGTTSVDTTGANLLPAVDLSKGFTAHLWMRPTESLVGVVTAYNLLNLGPVNEAVRVTFMIHLTRFASGPTDWWRRNITVYSDGSSSINRTNSDEVWEAPFTGGRVKIDSLPFEHVISVSPGTWSGSGAFPVNWYSSDGYSFGFDGFPTITPPDNNQYWPLFNVSGQPAFEGHVWAINIWNYPMGREAAFDLMRNPLQMYKSRSVGGYGANVAPGGTDPPTDDGNTTPGSAGPTTGPDPDRFDGEVPTPYSEEQFIYYGHHYEFLKDPLDVTRHDAYELDFNWARWKFIRRLWIAGISQATITLQIYIDEVLKHTTTFTLVPATGTGWARTRLLLPPGLKGQLFRFILTSASSFKIFLDQSDIEWHPLSTDRGYQRFPLDLSAQHERGGTIA